MDTHIPLCIFLCLWTVQITGVYGDQIKKIPEGYDLGRYKKNSVLIFCETGILDTELKPNCSIQKLSENNFYHFMTTAILVNPFIPKILKLILRN